MRLRVLAILVTLSAFPAGAAGQVPSDPNLGGWSCTIQATAFDPELDGQSGPIVMQCLEYDSQPETIWPYIFHAGDVAGNACSWTATGWFDTGTGYQDHYTLRVDGQSGSITLASGGTGPIVPDPKSYSRRCLVADSGGPRP